MASSAAIQLMVLPGISKRHFASFRQSATTEGALYHLCCYLYKSKATESGRDCKAHSVP